MRRLRLDLLLVFSLVSYRLTRFVHTDSILDEIRDKFQIWLVTRNKLWADKIYELSACPYCISVYTSAGTVWASWSHQGFLKSVYMWLAVCGLTMVIWRVVEKDELKIKVKDDPAVDG